MTAIREHREYSSNVVRDLTSRPISPYQTKLDSNLDLLLEDLQNSVSRPGSALGQPISQTTHHHVSFLEPANSSTVVRERSISPTSKKQFYSATSKYEYKSGGGGSNLRNDDTSVTQVYKSNINQLDNLLNDLERERDSSLDRHKKIQRSGVDSGLIESPPQGSETKIVKTTMFHESGKKTVNRELVYDPPGTGSLRSSRPRTRSPGYDNRQIDLESQIISDKSLTNGVRRIDHTPTRSEQFFAEGNSVATRSATPKVHYSEHVEESSGPDALNGLEIEKGMLPPPGTKVTTTVRTYTYELPEEPDRGIINKKIIVEDKTMNKTTTLPLMPAERDIPIPLAIEASPPTSSLTTYRSDASYPTQVDGVPGHTANKAMYYKKETRSSNTQYYPGAPDPTLLPRLTAPDESRPVQVYQETVTQNGPLPTSDPYGMNTITYRYTSSESNSNVRYPEREPLMPFPVDRNDTYPDGEYPKRVEDLMASFGDTTHSDTFTYVDKRRDVAEKPSTPTRVEDKQRSLVPIKQDPDNEMVTKSQESAAWQAGGGWAKGRGEYEYKAENRSKKSSKKGGAVVPVCLPLCCAMPCSIM